MLGSIVLLMCVVAGVVAVAILFVLYGPVPVRRKVTILSRMPAPDPFVHRPSALIVALPQPAPAPIHEVAPLPPMAAQSTPKPAVVPLVLRRPGNPNPPPLSRARAARGTEPRPQPLEELDQLDRTSQFEDRTAPLHLFEEDDDTFLSDGD